MKVRIQTPKTVDNKQYTKEEVPTSKGIYRSTQTLESALQYAISDGRNAFVVEENAIRPFVLSAWVRPFVKVRETVTLILSN